MDSTTPPLSMDPFEVYQQVFIPAVLQSNAEALLHYAALKPGERMLDVACGTGIVTRQAAPLLGRAGMITALDLSPKMLAVARSLPAPDGAEIDWREGNALALPFADRSYDVVLCQHGLQFFPDPLAGLSEMQRVLAPHGRVLIAVWQSLDRNPVHQRLYEIMARRLSSPGVTSPFSLGEATRLHTLMAEAGLHGIEIIPLTLRARYSSPEVFIHSSVIGAAAAVKELAVDVRAQHALIDALGQELGDTLAEYMDGRVVDIPLAAYIGRGYARSQG